MFTKQTLFYLPAIVMFLTACTGSRIETSGGVLQCKIYVTGNEPFTRLACEDAEGVVYLLSCSKELQEKLLKKQGQLVNLHCSHIKKQGKQNSATVVRFEVLEIKRKPEFIE